MIIALYIGADHLRDDARLIRLMSDLRAGGCEVYIVESECVPREGTDILLSVGGDGTFLTAAMIAMKNSTPVVGVNMGRMGFLSEGRPDEVVDAILSGDFKVETQNVLEAEIHIEGNRFGDAVPYALNDMTLRRTGPAMLETDVCVNGVSLPTYRGDGLVISTSSGSTAYSLSVGGPIVLPESEVLILSPIASHNLNVRPLVIPDTSEIVLSGHSRDGYFELTADNRTYELPASAEIVVKMAQFSLKRVRLNKSNFIQALTDKLYWGEDVRNQR